MLDIVVNVFRIPLCFTLAIYKTKDKGEKLLQMELKQTSILPMLLYVEIHLFYLYTFILNKPNECTNS